MPGANNGEQLREDMTLLVTAASAFVAFMRAGAQDPSSLVRIYNLASKEDKVVLNVITDMLNEDPSVLIEASNRITQQIGEGNYIANVKRLAGVN